MVLVCICSDLYALWSYTLSLSTLQDEYSLLENGASSNNNLDTPHL